MKLHELSSATGSRHTRKRVGRGTVAAWVKHQLADIKVKTHVPVAAFVLDSRVDKTHYIVVYLNVVSRIVSVRNTQSLTLKN